MDTSYKEQNHIVPISTFETIDSALYKWLDETLDIHATTNTGVRKIPINWFSRERVYQIKVEKDDRDENGILDFPQIQLTRTATVKAPVADNPIPGLFRPNTNYKGGQFGFWKRVQQDKTKNFANAKAKRLYGQQNYKFNNNEIVYEWVFVPFPAYYNVSYEISMKALFMQQINEMTMPVHRVISPYNTRVFKITYNDFRYEAFIEDSLNFTTSTPDLNEAERIFEAKFVIKVLGFTTTSDVNQNTPNIVYKETPVKTRINRERTIIGDINDVGYPDTPYRE